MSYTPTTWVTGDTITATKLNKMEQGIAGAGAGDILFDIGVADGVLDKTWTEIYTAVASGKIVRILESGEGFAFSAYVAAANTDEEFWYVYLAGENGWYQTSTANGYPEFTD